MPKIYRYEQVRRPTRKRCALAFGFLVASGWAIAVDSGPPPFYLRKLQAGSAVEIDVRGSSGPVEIEVEVWPPGGGAPVSLPPVSAPGTTGGVLRGPVIPEEMGGGSVRVRIRKKGTRKLIEVKGGTVRYGT